MDTTNVKLIINIIDNKSRATNTKHVYTSDRLHIVNYFIEWMNNINNTTFSIESITETYKIKFYIYTRSPTIDNKYIVIIETKFLNTFSKYSYEVCNFTDRIKQENISDIISMFIRVCNGEISYFKADTITELISTQMQRIGIILQ